MSVLVMNFYGVPGGAERRFVRTFKKMQELGGRHSFIINAHGKSALETVGVSLDLDNVTVKNDFRVFGRLSPVSKIVFVFQLWWYVISQKCKHLHYPVDPSYLTLFHSLIGRFFGVSYSLSIVGSTRTDRKNFNRYSWFLWRRSVSHATRLDCLSENIARNVTTLFKLVPPIEVSPCSFTDYTKSFVAEKKDFDVVLMSRLCEGKGLELFFDSLMCLKKSDFSIGKIGIFGGGPLHDYVQARIQEFPSMDIEFGYASNPFDILSRTKIFLSLQEKENYPSQSLLEAVSCGAMIVATDVGETYRIVSDEVGYRVPPNATALADKLVVALTRLRMNQFDWVESVKRVREVHTVERFSAYFTDFLNRAR